MSKAKPIDFFKRAIVAAIYDLYRSAYRLRQSRSQAQRYAGTFDSDLLVYLFLGFAATFAISERIDRGQLHSMLDWEINRALARRARDAATPAWGRGK